MGSWELTRRRENPDRMVQPRCTAEEMFPLVEQYNERPQSAAAYCTEQGISYGPLNYWRRKYCQETAAEDSRGFVEVGNAPPREAVQEEIAFCTRGWHYSPQVTHHTCWAEIPEIFRQPCQRELTRTDEQSNRDG